MYVVIHITRSSAFFVQFYHLIQWRFILRYNPGQVVRVNLNIILKTYALVNPEFKERKTPSFFFLKTMWLLNALVNPDSIFFENRVDLDQLASEEAN